MSQTASISRDSLMQLGRAGQPWQFHSLMRQIGDAADSDPAIVFLHAANLAKLGLKELAAQRFGQLPFQVRQLPDVSALWGAISALPASTISREEHLQNFEANVAALIARDVAPSTISIWRHSLLEQLDSLTILRAADGNIVIPGATENDHRSRSRELINSPQDAADYAAALVIDGLSPPWLLADAAARWPKNNLNFWRRLIVVHEDVPSLAIALASVNLAAEIAQSRTWLFLGEGSAKRFTEYLKLHSDELLVSRLISLRESDIQGSDLADIINTASQAQADELKVLHDRAQLQYAPRNKAYWANRYKKAASGGDPLRILVPTTRYSTFIQHSSRDIVDAFAALGHKAKLLIEPDDSCVLAANAFWRTYCEFDPDLVVLINFPRPLRESTTPANIPFVTWLQDAMPHLFEKSLAARLGDLDFTCGYLFNECFHTNNWKGEQAIACPIPVSPRKFHDGRVSGFDELTCDVAFVSNHSKTLEQVHDRLIAGISDILTDRNVAACIEPLRKLVHNVVDRVASERLWDIMPWDERMLTNSFGVSLEYSTRLLNSYAIPMASEVFRQQALLWTHEICLRRGWKFHLYGKGWEQHPTLSRWARGPIAHGEPLRAAYQKAAVHLHLDLNNIMHQRTCECFLSGGLVLSRFFADALDPAALRAEKEMIDTAADCVGAPDCRIGWVTQLHEPLRKHEELAASLGVAVRYPEQIWPLPWASRQAIRNTPLFEGFDAVKMLDCLRNVTFRDSQQLEALLARAVDPTTGYRARTIAQIRPRIQQAMTYDSQCARLLELITRRLG